MQLAGFSFLGLAATYEALDVPPECLADRFRQLVAAGYQGWNLTVPLKEAALPLLDWADATVTRAESVNTIVVRDGRLLGYSTDGHGLAAALGEAFGFAISGQTIAMLGCGGAGRAAAVELAARGAARLLLINRTLDRARQTAARIAAVNPGCVTACFAPDDPALPAVLAVAHLLVQATALGLKPDDPPPLNPAWLPAGRPVFDMIYQSTPLQRAAAARGCPVADGRGMLLHQGARSFTLWTGRDAPVEAMRRALNQALAAPEVLIGATLLKKGDPPALRAS